MSFALNNKKPSKGDRLKWSAPSTGAQPVHFDKSGQPVKLTEKELALIRQSKGKPLVP